MTDEDLRSQLKLWAEQRSPRAPSRYDDVLHRARVHSQQRIALAMVGAAVLAAMTILVGLPTLRSPASTSAPTSAAPGSAAPTAGSTSAMTFAEAKTWVLQSVTHGHATVPLPSGRSSLSFGPGTWDAFDGVNDHTGFTTWQGDSVTLAERSVSGVPYPPGTLALGEFIEKYLADKTFAVQVDNNTLSLTSAVAKLSYTQQ